MTGNIKNSEDENIIAIKQKAWKNLLDILKSINGFKDELDDDSLILRTLKLTLWNFPSKDKAKVDKISDLKNILLEKYGGSINNTPIFKFSEYLFAHPNLPKLDIIKDYESLNEYIDRNRENIKNIISSLDNPNYNSKQNVYPYLLVVARPFGNDLFYLEAELIIYYCQDKPTSYYQDKPTRYKLRIDNDENIDTNGKIRCSFKDIANNIGKFIKQSKDLIIRPKKLRCEHRFITHLPHPNCHNR